MLGFDAATSVYRFTDQQVSLVKEIALAKGAKYKNAELGSWESGAFYGGGSKVPVAGLPAWASTFVPGDLAEMAFASLTGLPYNTNILERGDTKTDFELGDTRIEIRSGLDDLLKCRMGAMINYDFIVGATVHPSMQWLQFTGWSTPPPEGWEETHMYESGWNYTKTRSHLQPFAELLLAIHKYLQAAA